MLLFTGTLAVGSDGIDTGIDSDTDARRGTGAGGGVSGKYAPRCTKFIASDATSVVTATTASCFGVARIDLLQLLGALRQVADQAPRLLGEVARPAVHGRHELALVAADQLRRRPRFVRRAVFGFVQVVEDRSEVAVQTRRRRLRVDRVVLVVLLERVVDAR